ncbi:MAG: glycine cleavage system aminomethyltransferase GcvT [Gammaproteobacteria bacterium]|nr:glycine cleavage system aminomethyltransferase GcvT [Gammaproteobacteria bacterium]
MSIAPTLEADRPKRTALYPLLESAGAKFVSFAGYWMPLQFPQGIRHEHLHTRSRAGLFDISHMGQILITGADPATSLEALVPGDICGLSGYQQRYTQFTNDRGGIRDDIMVTRLPEGLWLVVNAATKAADLTYLDGNLEGQCAVSAQQRALLALQGPEAARVMESLCPGAERIPFLHCTRLLLAGAPVLVHRCGYTGEDGFEISMEEENAESCARALLQMPGVELVGLGARDTLRLEAGMCLYGQDLDESTTPVEARLGWTIARRFRQEPSAARFPGASIVLKQLLEGTVRLRVGLLPDGRTPARAGTQLFDADESTGGQVTSGGFSPTLDRPCAMGYVATRFSKPGTRLLAKVRDRLHEVEVSPLPFVPHRYFTPASTKETL